MFLNTRFQLFFYFFIGALFFSEALLICSEGTPQGLYHSSYGWVPKGSPLFPQQQAAQVPLVQQMPPMQQHPCGYQGVMPPQQQQLYSAYQMYGQILSVPMFCLCSLPQCLMMEKSFAAGIPEQQKQKPQELVLRADGNFVDPVTGVIYQMVNPDRTPVSLYEADNRSVEKTQGQREALTERRRRQELTQKQQVVELANKVRLEAQKKREQEREEKVRLELQKQTEEEAARKIKEEQEKRAQEERVLQEKRSLEQEKAAQVKKEKEEQQQEEQQKQQQKAAQQRDEELQRQQKEQKRVEEPLKRKPIQNVPTCKRLSSGATERLASQFNAVIVSEEGVTAKPGKVCILHSSPVLKSPDVSKVKKAQSKKSVAFKSGQKSKDGQDDFDDLLNLFKEKDAEEEKALEKKMLVQKKFDIFWLLARNEDMMKMKPVSSLLTSEQLEQFKFVEKLPSLNPKTLKLDKHVRYCGFFKLGPVAGQEFKAISDSLSTGDHLGKRYSFYSLLQAVLYRLPQKIVSSSTKPLSCILPPLSCIVEGRDPFVVEYYKGLNWVNDKFNFLLVTSYPFVTERADIILPRFLALSDSTSYVCKYQNTTRIYNVLRAMKESLIFVLENQANTVKIVTDLQSEPIDNDPDLLMLFYEAVISFKRCFERHEDDDFFQKTLRKTRLFFIGLLAGSIARKSLDQLSSQTDFLSEYKKLEEYQRENMSGFLSGCEKLFSQIHLLPPKEEISVSNVHQIYLISKESMDLENKLCKDSRLSSLFNSKFSLVVKFIEKIRETERFKNELQEELDYFNKQSSSK